MKQVLTKQAQDDVLAEWRGLHLESRDPIKKYTEQFWDLNLRVCVLKRFASMHRRKNVV